MHTNRRPLRRRRLRVALISAAVLGACAVVVAEQVTVKRPQAEVLDAKGSAGEVIEVVPKNSQLEVLGKEGVWLRVRTPSGKEGYIAKAVLESGSGGTDLSGVGGNSAVTPTETAAAGRGWDKEVEAYAANKQLDRRGLERMEAMRKACCGKTLRDFKTDGNLGPSH